MAESAQMSFVIWRQDVCRGRHKPLAANTSLPNDWHKIITDYRSVTRRPHALGWENDLPGSMLHQLRDAFIGLAGQVMF